MTFRSKQEMAMGQFGIGQPLRRFEDRRLLRGNGRFQGDANVPGQAYAVVLRSPHAHARIVSLDTAPALAAPGVLAVLTGDDLVAAKLGVMGVSLPRKRPDGSPMFARAFLGLAQGRVRYVGEPVAFVVAETLAQARDAAELVAVDYDILPSVTDTAEAAAGKAAVWDECPDNISNLFEAGNKAAAEAALAGAAHIVKRRYVISRVYAHFMEPRGAIGVWDPGDERFTLYADVQYPHRVRQALATRIFKIPESHIRVVAGDVGGGFGTKGWQYPEHRLVLLAAKMLRRPVKWTCERSEAVLADEHARDNVSEAELALDAEGRFLGLRVKTLANVGAYVSSERNLLASFSNVGTLTGVYDIPAAHVAVLAVMANTNGTAPYRGAGRPEATYVIERLIDDAARELGHDPLALRRRNMIPTARLPYKTALGLNYDVGDFAANQQRALEMADWAGFPGRRTESEKRGKLRGIGIANPIEKAAGPGQEFAEIRFHPSGNATLLMGSKNQGQGHETTFKQILSERLGIDPTDIQYIDGDTDRVAFGIGTNGSRSTVIGGSAVFMAADKIIAKGRRLAAHLLEAAEADIEFGEGQFTVAGTDRAVALAEVAKAAFRANNLPPGLEGGLYETGTFAPSDFTYPNGSHVCEVEIDPETGALEIVNYVVVDDVGTVVNPIGLKGQIHGGVAQGLGQALMEEVVYDRESGQNLSGSFMDYAMPRADNMPYMHIESNPVPTARNPLGAKGA
ncbi:MAG TPA: xanthine dehydrogenase family protein molybdopterin-binding subunit, partial [Stellaceae bacterium]|nr:xanthine dehydrogenase family protein molybdopterin-binding subunit [Stellaceae bacterium]